MRKALDPVALGNPNLFAFVKWSRDRTERSLVVINKDRAHAQLFSTQWTGQVFAGAGRFEDVSPDRRAGTSPDYTGW